MAKVKVQSSSESSKSKMRPALTPEAREGQMIALAMDLVQERLANGTASSQETTHFLKLATAKARLEREKLAMETELLAAKKKSLDSQDEIKELYDGAIKAMRAYGGQGDDEDYEDVY